MKRLLVALVLLAGCNQPPSASHSPSDYRSDAPRQGDRGRTVTPPNPQDRSDQPRQPDNGKVTPPNDK